MSEHGVACSMSRASNCWDNAATESFFSSLKTERTARKTYKHKAVFDPRGGAWIGGRYVPSVLAEIGDIVQQHLDATVIATEFVADAPSTQTRRASCPKCGAPGLVRKEGCDTCFECGYSKCG